MGYRALGHFSGVWVPTFPAASGVLPFPSCGSDNDRANLMWKRYLEREDSKIVGMERHGNRENREINRGRGGDLEWECRPGKEDDAVKGCGNSWVIKMWKRGAGLLGMLVRGIKVRQRGGKRNPGRRPGLSVTLLPSASV